MQQEKISPQNQAQITGWFEVIARSIDKRLEVTKVREQKGPRMVAGGVPVPPRDTDFRERVLVKAGEIIVTAFPADEVFDEGMVRSEILKGIRSMTGKVIRL